MWFLYFQGFPFFYGGCHFTILFLLICDSFSWFFLCFLFFCCFLFFVVATFHLARFCWYMIHSFSFLCASFFFFFFFETFSGVIFNSVGAIFCFLGYADMGFILLASMWFFFFLFGIIFSSYWLMLMIDSIFIYSARLPFHFFSLFLLFSLFPFHFELVIYHFWC